MCTLDVCPCAFALTGCPPGHVGAGALLIHARVSDKLRLWYGGRRGVLWTDGLAGVT
jgi:hypothetical protein